MKKIFLYIVIVICITLILPITLTKKFSILKVSAKEDETNNSNDEQKLDYQYSDYATIKLLHHKDGQVEELKIDDYLLGVVSAEMPADYDEEALKAQAVVARTYTIYMIKNSKSKHDNADICDDPSCCQAWISKDDRFARWEEDKREENWKKIEDAVYSTQGEIITYDGNPIEAFFHSNSGGKTEEVSNVWGGTDLPYLQSVETAGEDAYSQYASEVNISKEEFEKKMKEKYANFSIDYSLNDCIKVTEYTDGNRVKTIKIGNENISGVEIRTIIGLKSANFSVEINGDMINFKVKGYGHGVRNEPNWS